MTREEARKIANYALPRFLHNLPMQMKFELLKRGESGNEESLLEQLTAKLAADIHWAAIGLEQEERTRHI